MIGSRVTRGTAVAATAVLLALAMSACGPVGGKEPGQAAGVPQGPGSSAPSMPLAAKVVPAAGAYLGVYAPDAPFNILPLSEYDSKAGRKAGIVMWYQPWVVGNRYLFDEGACAEIWREGKVPMITWEPWDPGQHAHLLTHPAVQPTFTLAAIDAGKFDGYIRSWAHAIRDIGGPVMLRPMHEMNGNWYPWAGTANGNKPAEFVVAWRRIHDIFRDAGATNVTWVWSINTESVPAEPSNSYAAYYPGASYVDWTAISGFNWGRTRPNSTWRSFTSIYSAPLAYLKSIGKPICIAEFGSVEQGGDKAAWLTDAYKRIQAVPQVKAVIYYDAFDQQTAGAQDWRIDTSAASLAAFKRAIAPGYYLSGAPVALAHWQSKLTSAGTAFLNTVPNRY